MSVAMIGTGNVGGDLGARLALRIHLATAGGLGRTSGFKWVGR